MIPHSSTQYRAYDFKWELVSKFQQRFLVLHLAQYTVGLTALYLKSLLDDCKWDTLVTSGAGVVF